MSLQLSGVRSLAQATELMQSGNFDLQQQMEPLIIYFFLTIMYAATIFVSLLFV